MAPACRLRTNGPPFQIMVEREPELLAGLHQTEHDVSRDAAVAATNYVCAGLIVPPEILRFVTKVRRSFSDAVVCSGMLGCSGAVCNAYRDPQSLLLLRTKGVE